MMIESPRWPQWWIVVLLAVAIGIGAALMIPRRGNLPPGVPVVLTF